MAFDKTDIVVRRGTRLAIVHAGSGPKSCFNDPRGIDVGFVLTGVDSDKKKIEKPATIDENIR